MKLNYYADTDSPNIDLSEWPSSESGAQRGSPWCGILSVGLRPRPKGREITEGVVLDYDAEGNLVGIDIDNASQKLDLKKLSLNKLPASIQTNPACPFSWSGRSTTLISRINSVLGNKSRFRPELQA